MDFEGVDLESAMQAVLDDMGEAAKQFKAKKYAPKPKAPEAAPEPAKVEADGSAPTMGELEAMLNGG